jgi:hypothetical protein
VDRIVEKIKKLLALAEDQAGRPEGEAAAAIALRLMAQHAVEESTLGQDTGVVQERVIIATSNWLKELWWTLANHCQVQAYFSKRTRGAQPAMLLFGARADIDVTKYLVGVCEDEIDRKCKEFLRGGAFGKTAGTQFRRSAVAGLYQKLREQRGELKQEYAMVLASRKDKAKTEAEKLFKPKEVRLPDYRVSTAGWYAGYQMEIKKGLEG